VRLAVDFKEFSAADRAQKLVQVGGERNARPTEYPKWRSKPASQMQNYADSRRIDQLARRISRFDEMSNASLFS
jgi:hypothetical protein